MKSFGLLTIAAVLATAVGCASAPKPVPLPPPPAAVQPPAPVVAAPKPAPAPPKKAAPTPMRPSVSSATSIVFDGKTFTLQYHGDNNGVALREYFLRNESSKAWTRLVELLVYPTAGKGIGPADHAAKVADGYKATYPYARYTVHPNKDGSATLDFTAWDDASLKAHYTEYNVFEFFPAVKGGNLVGFHYVERLYSDPKATTSQNAANTAAIKQKVMAQLAKLPLYRE